MLGLFQSASVSPVPTFEKVWVEQRLRWLAGAFGPRRLLEARVIEPTPEFFPDAYDESRQAAEVVFQRVCAYMDVPRERVRLDFLDSEVWQLGDYTRFEPERVRLNEKTFARPMQLAVTCAHELAHVLLLGDERLTVLANDHERTTDLLMVYLGFGVLAANAALLDGPEGRIHGMGYLSERELSYALALFAWLRGEPSPEWTRHLRANARRVFDDALTYLDRTGDCSIRPQDFTKIDDRFVQTPPQELIAALCAEFPGRRLAALWEVQRTRPIAGEVAEAVAPLLNDADVDVRRHAAITLGYANPDSAAACAALLTAALRESDSEVRGNIAVALGRLAAPSPDVVPTLRRLLADPDEDVRASAARALGHYADWLDERSIDALCGLCANDPSLVVREFGLRTLAELPPSQLLKILPQLLELFEEPERTLYGQVLHVLSRLGPSAAAAVPQIRTMLHRGDPFGRAAAALALARISGSARDAVRALRHTRPLPVKGNRLHGEGYAPAVQATVADVLRDLGESAVDPLLALLPAKTLTDAVFVAWGLGQVGELPERALKARAALLDHPERLVRFLAAVARRRVDGADDPAAALWLEFLRHQPLPGRHPEDLNACFGRAAAEILMEIGEPLAPAAVVALSKKDAAEGIAEWLGELAAMRPAVLGLLVHERDTATGETRRRLELALRRHATVSSALEHAERRRLSYPPEFEDPTDPIDAALDYLWAWFAHLLQEKAKGSDTDQTSRPNLAGSPKLP